MLERWRRHLRRAHDAGSASMVSYVVAAAVFLIASSYMMHFMVDPPGTSTSNLAHAEVREKGVQMLDVLLGSAGTPATWGTTLQSVDGVSRLGLTEPGSSVRVDPAKFDALARGKYATAHNQNGAVDYAEAKLTLGLTGYDFHLRAYPITSPVAEGPYGMNDMGDFEVAYVGDFDQGAMQPVATAEVAALSALGLPFSSQLRDVSASGDVYKDDGNDLRENLLVNLGQTIQQTVIGQGAGTKFDFYRVDKTTYDEGLAATGADSTAMALSSDGWTLGYTKNREIRAIVGTIDTTGLGSATLAWREWVDTDRNNMSYDCGDYGWVEVSKDDGETWVQLTNSYAERSDDCSDIPNQVTPHLPAMASRTKVLDDTTCDGCMDKPSVIVAFHWLADNDNNVGYGWVVDDVVVTSGSSTLLRKTFEAPAYQMLIIGSNTANNAFTSAEVKDGIRDYVDKYGGRLLVLGGQSNVQWLDRLFDASLGSSATPLSSDSAHPLLSLPNSLSYATYPRAASDWDLRSSADAGLFTQIVGSDPNVHALAVSQKSAFGSGSADEGAVMLTSYLPGQFEVEERKRFFANALVYGRFHYLHLDVGPPVPEHEAVASATRTAIMNKFRTGPANYTEMAFIMHVWPGASSAATAAAFSVNAMPPRDLVAVPGNGYVDLTWKWALSNGTGTPVSFEIYRGLSPGSVALLASVSAPASNGPLSFSYTDPTVTNGAPYYYDVRLKTSAGEGAPSLGASATPMAPPGAPTNVQAAPGQDTIGTPPVNVPVAGTIDVTWTPPTQTGPGIIYGYQVDVNDSAGGWTLVGDLGNVTKFRHTVPDQGEHRYRVRAVNAAGWGIESALSAFTRATGQAQAPTLQVTNATPNQLTLNYVAPQELGGGTHTGYKIHRSPDNVTWYQLATSNQILNGTWQDKNVTDGTTYWYRIQAVTDLGDGLNSTAHAHNTTNVPAAPTGLNKLASTPTSITMNWTLPLNNGGSPVTAYRIYRGATPETQVFLTEVTTLTHTDVTSGTWSYAVSAVNLAGEGLRSGSVTMAATL